MTRRDWIKSQLSENLDEILAVHMWSEVDIREKANELDLELSDIQVEEVAARMEDLVDAATGMNWIKTQSLKD